MKNQSISYIPLFEGRVSAGETKSLQKFLIEHHRVWLTNDKSYAMMNTKIQKHILHFDFKLIEALKKPAFYRKHYDMKNPKIQKARLEKFAEKFLIYDKNWI